MPRRETLIVSGGYPHDASGSPCPSGGNASSRARDCFASLAMTAKTPVIASEAKQSLALIPKLSLGTRLSAKLRFARSAARGMVRGNRRKCKAQLCPQARSQVKLGNEGETPVIASEAKQSPARQRPGVRNIPRFAPANPPHEGRTRTARALRAVHSIGRPLGRQKGWRKHPNGAHTP